MQKIKFPLHVKIISPAAFCFMFIYCAFLIYSAQDNAIRNNLIHVGLPIVNLFSFIVSTVESYGNAFVAYGKPELFEAGRHIYVAMWIISLSTTIILLRFRKSGEDYFGSIVLEKKTIKPKKLLLNYIIATIFIIFMCLIMLILPKFSTFDNPIVLLIKKSIFFVSFSVFLYFLICQFTKYKKIK